MASGDAERRITLRAIYDNTNLKTGTQESERYMDSLARAVDDSSDDMRRSLQSIDDGVSSTFSSGGSVDRSVGEADDRLGEFADTAREEVPGALLDMQDGATSAMQGLAQAFASIGPGGTIIATVLAGLTILVNRSESAAQAMRDRVNAAMDAIEVKAGTTNTQIARMYEKTLTFDKTLESFGGGDKTKGFAKLAEYADKLGVEVSDIVNLINGQWTPGAKALRDLMTYQLNTTKDTGLGYAVNLATLDGTRDTMLAILDAADTEKQTRAQTLAQERENRDVLAEQRDLRRSAAAAAEAEARWTRQTREEAERITNQVRQWAGQRLPDPTKAGGA